MVRSQFLGAFLMVFLIATGYFYAVFAAACATPLTYRVNVVDDRFGLDREAVEAATAAAITTWEAGVGQELFVATEERQVDVLVNFLFDERQVRTQAEGEARDLIDTIEARSIASREAYDVAAAEIAARQSAYETRLAAFEADGSRFDAVIAGYNAEGGAPPDVFAELIAEQERLQAEAATLRSEVRAINQDITALNQLNIAGNDLITTLNEQVADFNETFANGREFHQGEYQAGVIDVFSFADTDELHTVLVHELGHALGVDHVAEPAAFMHAILSDRNVTDQLHAEDKLAFRIVCSPESRLATVPQPWRSLFAFFGV